MKAIILLIGWTILVTYLSLMPATDSEVSLFPNQDKVIHFIFYLGMSFLAMFASKQVNYKSLLLVIFSTAAYGILMEMLQYYMNLGRHFDYFDIIANIIGSLTGSLLVYLLNRKLNASEKKRFN